ncbi:MAG: tRNA uridine-5-carboxymethylaminomethyl(34) synthesis GTPase MnmE [Candidatus Omnitrophica bacterium]|nr:tRNA uridine-5-carboxymethylaminomethyl(34) synthesis GTPase MnmE [Candidatus Omnitrophota bacterium]
MKNFDSDDTIAAISTAAGTSGIGIVRISGKDAFSVADKIFTSKDKIKPSQFDTYTLHYGWIASPQPAGRHRLAADIIDEVLLTVMRAPKSYTREDIVEINCHGGMAALKRVLELVLDSGCRIAEPGEFTRRAFLNGRIDLAQAEAVLDIINAKTERALKISLGQLKGEVSCKIRFIREELLRIFSRMEASIDFPDDEVSPGSPGDLSAGLKKVANELKNILDTSRYGRIIREGVRVAICGRPNVGKSSLLNAILKEERSIVTPIAGTTRDTVEEAVNIQGVAVEIIDTAGILKPRGLIEKEAVRRSHVSIASADVVVLLFDSSRSLGKEDLMLMRKLNKKTVIAALNKTDLKQKIRKDFLNKQFGRLIEISAKKRKNIKLLEEEIISLVFHGRLDIPSDGVLVSDLRHIEALKKTQKFVAEALNSLDNNLSLEFVSQDVKEALYGLDVILGLEFSEELLDKIFSEFCIGK